jgi:glycosyltransferase involved in cell wall biosynthesis
LVKYRERVDSSGLRDHVIFEGPIPHEKIFEYIADADIAYSDVRVTHGFPMKIFEYMAMGKPMVVEGGESVKELLTDRIHALLYESEAELTEKILTLVRDGELRKRIGENARQVSNAHTWEKRGEALTSIYEQYLGGKR